MCPQCRAATFGGHSRLPLGQAVSSVRMETTDGSGQRTCFAHAFLTVGLMSEDLSRVAAETLGRSSSGNRDVQLLNAVTAEPGITPSTAAAALGMTRSAVSRSLANLTADALVVREPNPDDHRSARLFATPAAEQRVAAFEAALTEYLTENADTLRELAAALDPPDEPLPGGTGPTPDSTGPGQPPDSTAQTIREFARVGSDFVDAIMEWAPEWGLRHRTDRTALSLVHQRGAVSPSELASTLHMSSGGTTLLLNRLDRHGLVVRCRPEDSQDRRLVSVRCTPRGAEAADRLVAEFASRASEFGRAFARAAAVPPLS